PLSPLRRTRQAPAFSSMTSGAPVLNVRVDGKMRPMVFFDPSGKITVWLTHLPSKYTLAFFTTLTLSNWDMLGSFRTRRLEGDEGRPVRPLAQSALRGERPRNAGHPSLLFAFSQVGRNAHAQRIELDEAGRIGLVVGAPVVV